MSLIDKLTTGLGTGLLEGLNPAVNGGGVLDKLDTSAQMLDAMGWGGSFSHYYNMKGSALPLADGIGGSPFTSSTGSPVFAQSLGVEGVYGVDTQASSPARVILGSGAAWSVAANQAVTVVSLFRLSGTAGVNTLRDLGPISSTVATRWAFRTTAGSRIGFQLQDSGGTTQATTSTGPLLDANQTYIVVGQRLTSNFFPSVYIHRIGDGSNASATTSTARTGALNDSTAGRVGPSGTLNGSNVALIQGPIGVAIGAGADVQITLTHLANLASYLSS